MSFLFDMESSTGQSLTGQSNVTGIIDSGISVNLLLFGENLVEKAFEEALEVVREYNYSEVSFNGAGNFVCILWSLKFIRMEK